MKNYAYKARDNSGKMVKGVTVAENELDLSKKLSKQNLFLIYAEVKAMKKVVAKIPRLPQQEVLNFTIQLATLLDAGMPLVGGLSDLAKDAPNEEIRTVISDIRSRVESGSTLKEALSYHKKTFSDLYISNIGAGESTGQLGLVLNDLCGFLEWQMDLKGKIKEASIYPIILFLAMTGVVALLVVKILPMFKPIFEELKVDLPATTQFFLSISDFVVGYWYVIIGVILLFVGSLKLFYSTENGHLILDRLKLKVPIFGILIHKIVLSRFCHTLALTLQAGVTVLSALDISAQVIGNKFIERVIVKSRNAVNVGEKIAASLDSSGPGVFPPLVIRMISVGEQSGHLIQTLHKVNQFYDKEVPSAIKKMFAMFEPLMIVIMGIIVGMIALSIITPLMQITTSL